MRVLFIFIIILLADLFFMQDLESHIGPKATIAINYLSGFIGLMIVRKGIIKHAIQALKKLIKKEKILEHGLEALSLLICGALFLIPGTLTDVMGILILIPLTRSLFIKHILTKLLQRNK